MLTEDQKTFLDNLYEQSRLCEVCPYAAEGCTGGVRGGPNGPIFPPCADGDYECFIDIVALEELMLEEKTNVEDND